MSFKKGLGKYSTLFHKWMGLVIGASLLAVVFSVTGIIMLFFRFKRRDFGLGN